MTQAQLADLTGISQSQLSKYLRAAVAPNLDEFGAICDALGLHGDELLREARVATVGGSKDERADLRAAIQRRAAEGDESLGTM